MWANQYLKETYYVPESQLSFTHAAEARGEDVTIREENGPHGSSALVCLLLLLWNIFQWSPSVRLNYQLVHSLLKVNVGYKTMKLHLAPGKLPILQIITPVINEAEVHCIKSWRYRSGMSSSYYSFQKPKEEKTNFDLGIQLHDCFPIQIDVHIFNYTGLFDTFCYI